MGKILVRLAQYTLILQERNGLYILPKGSYVIGYLSISFKVPEET